MLHWSGVRVVEAIGFGYRTNLDLLPPESPPNVYGDSYLNALEKNLSIKWQGLLF